MKWIIAIGINALGSYFLQMFFPWWSIIIFPLFTGMFLLKNAFHALFAGFMGIFLLWLVHAWLLDWQTGHILSQKIAAVFGLPSSFLIILVGSLLGGIVAGVSGLTGFYFKKLFIKNNRAGFSK
jgi:uncharacterized Tic20 family protein